MTKPMLSASLALAALISLGISGVDNASARDGRNGAFVAGAAVGAVGGAIIGSEVSRERYDHRPYYSQARCHFERRVVRDDYSGDTVIQRVRVCSRPGY